MYVKRSSAVVLVALLVSNVSAQEASIVTSKEFSKPESSVQLFKNESGSFGVWYDDKKWTPQSTQGDTTFPKLKTGFIQKKRGVGWTAEWTIFMSESQSNIEQLKEDLLDFFKSNGQNTKIILEEHRVVNGYQVLAVLMTFDLGPNPWKFYGYFLSRDSEAAALWAFYSATKNILFEGFEEDMQDFFNGFVLL